MAKSTGKFGSLSQLQPLQGDIATDILNREDQQFKHREEKRITDALTKKEVDELAAKKKLEADQYAKDYERLGYDESGIVSHDAKTIDLFTRQGGTLEQFNNVYERLQKNPLDKEAIIIKQNLLKTSDNINALKQGIVQRREAIAKGIADGTLSPELNKDMLSNYNKMIDGMKYNYEFNKDGTVYVKNEGFDANGDGKVDGMDKISVQDVLDPNKLQGANKFDAQGFATQTKQNYGTVTKKTDGTEYVGFDMGKLESLKAEIDARMGADLASMTNDGKSLASDWNKIDYNSLTEAEFTKLKDNLAQKVINSYNTTDNKTTDWQGKNYDLALAKFNHQKSQDAKAEKTADQSGIDGFTPATDSKGNVLKGNGTKNDLWINGWSPKMSTQGGDIFVTDASKEKAMLYGDNYLSLEQIEVSEDGEMTVTGIESTQDETTKQWTNTRITITDETDINLIAKAKGYKNYQEFSQDLLRKKNEKKGGGKTTNGAFNAESFYNNFKSGK
jgi:hypothetical protein